MESKIEKYAYFMYLFVCPKIPCNHCEVHIALKDNVSSVDVNFTFQTSGY